MSPNTIVHGVLPSAASAEAVIEQLMVEGTQGPVFVAKAFPSGEIDPYALPRPATDIRGRTVIGAIAGGGFAAAAGVFAGTSHVLVGMTPALGAAFGVLIGSLGGCLFALVASNRKPKAALRESAAKMAAGQVLMTVEVEDPDRVAYVVALLSRRDALRVATC